MIISKRRFSIIALIITILDLLTKVLLVKYGIEIQNLLGIVNIILVKNYGISFGIFNSHNYEILHQVILSIIALCIIIYIILYCPLSIGTSFIIGGALGNLLNRIYSGYVVDFIDIFISKYHWPAFNLADSFICIGGILFLIEERLFYTKHKKNNFK